MAGRPFKVSEPTARNISDPGARPRHNPAATNAHAVKQGETLMEAAAELEPPDHEVGGVDDSGSEDGERPTHKPNLPWPDAGVGKAVTKQPWKGLK
jgi:hypothetical protein